MNDAEALDRAARAAEAWGGLATPPRLIVNRENAVFDVTLASGQRAALRLHRPGYQSPETIISELRWTEALADAGFPCPWPQRTVDGGFIHTPDDGGPIASVVLWVPGEEIGAMGEQFGGTADEQTGLYRRLGGLLADLHLTSDSTAPTDLTRHAWDIDAFCSDTPLWGRFWENPSLTPKESQFLLTARDDARDRLTKRGTDGYGLIHADVLQENVLRDGRQLYLIDFDDGGFGYRLYDLGTALIQHEGQPNFDALKAAMIDGYRAEGGTLTDDDAAEIDLFVMLRGLASTGWVMSRAAPDDTKQRTYAERGLRTARRWLDR
ncbi:phosphotransferase enzyme family protein [Qingshengfaniella alkalisoli]|uniref:Phosphotransferase n=1 Tax=Qingshengfaniella alkalisoli TaxID=2599296 RepID=A0A5B8I9Z1_9RHOB|nr:phosphotransferase [Qingshengfaniella alkalisoli]QDY69946.1 phosphotransferase [Qingshengfaniella alkalisoli]